MARKLEVNIVGDSSSLQRALGNATSSGSKFGKVFGKVVKAGALGAGAALVGLGIAAKIGFDEFSQNQKVAAQTNAVLKSTGRVANVTAKGVEHLGDSLMRKSGIDDEVIKSGENMLLTFRGIRNETGQGNKIFDQATKATLDLSVAMGKDMSSSAILVGKALQDPIRGLGALRRVGIQFTTAQEAQIKAMVESGDVMGAQKLILRELNAEFGGSAKALGKTLPGQINILKESFADLMGNLVGKVAPQLQKFLKKFTFAKGFHAKLNVVWTGVKDAAEKLYLQLKFALFGTITSKPIRLPSGKILEFESVETQGLVDKIKEGLQSVDWSLVGQTITMGIMTAVNAHSGQFAETGAKLALQIVSKLLDPAFWAQNWQLIAGIAIALFPITRIGSLGGKAALAILGPLGRLLPEGFRLIGSRAVTFILTQLGRLPGAVQGIILRVIGELGKFVSYIKGAVTTQLARVPGLLTAAFRLGIFITFVNGIKAGWEAIKNATSNAVDFLSRQWGRIPGPIKTVLDWINRVLGALQTLVSHPWTIVLNIPHPSLPNIPGIPGFAKGGVVPGPIGAPRLVMAHGGETITPAGRGGTVVNFNFPNFVGDERVIEAAVRRAATSFERRNSRPLF